MLLLVFWTIISRNYSHSVKQLLLASRCLQLKGLTPLHAAIKHGHEGLVEILLQASTMVKRELLDVSRVSILCSNLSLLFHNVDELMLMWRGCCRLLGYCCTCSAAHGAVAVLLRRGPPPLSNRFQHVKAGGHQLQRQRRACAADCRPLLSFSSSLNFEQHVVPTLLRIVLPCACSALS